MPDASVRSLRIGLVIVPGEDGLGISRWSEVSAFAQHAEAVGFDSLWVVDHLLFEAAVASGSPGGKRWGAWECGSMLSALAVATTRIALGTIVICTGFRNPALLAKIADTVDEISGGRLILGLGAGYHEPEYRAFGYPYDHLVGRFEEAIQIIHPLLRTGTVDFQGQYYQARNCELRPRGPRPSGPPIMIGAHRPRMFRLTAQYADSYNMFGHSDADGARPILEAVDAACTRIGRDPATLERTAGVLIDVPGAYQGPLGDEYRPYRTTLGAIVMDSPEGMATRLQGIVQMGVTHLQIWLEPSTRAAIDSFVPVMELLRRA